VQTLTVRLEPQDRQELPVTLDPPELLVNPVPLATEVQDPLERPDLKVHLEVLDKRVHLGNLGKLEVQAAAVRKAFARSIALLMVVFSSPNMANWCKRPSRNR